MRSVCRQAVRPESDARKSSGRDLELSSGSRSQIDNETDRMSPTLR